MDEVFTKITTVSDSNEASLLIDKSGRIIALNSQFQQLLHHALPNVDFFDLFDAKKKELLQGIFNNVKQNEVGSGDLLRVVTDKGEADYQVFISPLRSEKNIYFLVSFTQSESSKPRGGSQKFWIASKDLENLTDNKRLIALIDKIKLTFPFTFIEKAKIQKDANELDFPFWIKDISGKYLLVNSIFSVGFGFKANQIENKSEDEFLPGYLIELYKTIDQYLIKSGNAVIAEGISMPLIIGQDKNISLIELPLCDLDDNVVAIIGFTKREATLIKRVPALDSGFVHGLPFPVMILNHELKIAAYSRVLIKYLNLDERNNYLNTEASKILEKGIMNILEEILLKEEPLNDIRFNYAFIDRLKIKSEVHVRRIESFEGLEGSLQIGFFAIGGEEPGLEVKARMYDAIIDHAGEAMFIYDTENLKFLEVNEAALKLYGYKRSDFLNMDLTDLYAPEDIQTLITSGESKNVVTGYSGPWRHKKSDGTSLLVEINRSSIEFQGKRAHLNIVRDVVSQVETKKKNQLLEAIYEYTNDPIIRTDKEGFIVAINEPVTKRLGYSKKDLENTPFISLLSDDYRAKINKNLFHSGILKTTLLEVELKRPLGSVQKATLVATPIKDYNGDIDSFNLIIRLIEETVSAKDKRESDVKFNPKIDPPFLSNIFHEILTPINVILGFTQEIGESIASPNDEQKEALEIISENQKLLLQIMDNAVEYSTLEQNIIKYKPERIRFIDLLDELRENTRKSAETKKVEVSFGKISSSFELESDKQKFLSLISLFIKFAVQITRENNLYLSAETLDSGRCAIGIKDERESITPYLLKGLTDIFADDESVSRRNYGFSRFSVKLAKKLIELLSAGKEIISKEGEPSEFALVFPHDFIIADGKNIEVETAGSEKLPAQKAVPPKGSKRVPEKEVRKTASAQEPRKLDLTILSCLYLEDQVDSQMLFKVQLKELKSIEFSPSFENALPLLKTKKFDFIVMDINLQGEYNGLDALRIIRKMPGYQHIPIIASTAYLQPGARDNFIAAGFTDFVSKPLLRDRLIEVLKNIFA
jgi:PAS domain S-box-containing protein